MSEATIRRQDRGAMLNISVWDEEYGDYLASCPAHPETPAVDCVICEPVNSEYSAPPKAAHEKRPDDDPAPVPTCTGRDCGGQPHE